MRQFFQFDTDNAFKDLEQRANVGCVVFTNQELPAFCVPSSARIGFSVDAKTKAASLLIDKGIFYCGSEPKVSEWIKAGTISFPNFQALKLWILTDLKADFEKDLDCLTETTTERVKSIGPIPADLAKLSGFPRAPQIYESAFVVNLIKIFGKSWGLDVRDIGTDFEWTVMDKLAENPDRTYLDVLDEMLSGAFALALVRGLTSVEVAIAPHVMCREVRK